MMKNIIYSAVILMSLSLFGLQKAYGETFGSDFTDLTPSALKDPVVLKTEDELAQYLQNIKPAAGGDSSERSARRASADFLTPDFAPGYGPVSVSPINLQDIEPAGGDAAPLQAVETREGVRLKIPDTLKAQN